MLKGWDKVLVLSHASPDGDTLGSASALLRGLVSLGKQVSFFCADPVPEKFSYLFAGLPLGGFEPAHVMTVDVADKALLGKAPQELVARVRSQLRRYTQLGDVNAQSQGGEIVNGRLCYRPEERVLLVDGEPVKLTATELKIVDLLMRNLGRVFPAEEIYRRVWNEEAYATENTVMVHIRRIREKIELNPKEPEYLKVVWGLGYKMEKAQ